MTLLDEQLGVRSHIAGRVLAQHLLLGRSHQAEQIARLGVVVIVVLPFVVIEHRPRRFQRRLLFSRRILPLAVTVRFVSDRRAVVAVHAHRSVTVIGMERAARPIDRNLLHIDSQTVTLRVAIREQTPLQHLVRRETDTLDDILGVERRLLHFGEIILRIPVQLQHPHLDQRKIPVRPDFRQVERMDTVGFGLRLRHHLDTQRPARKLAPFDSVVKVTLVRIAVVRDDFGRFLVG